VREAVVMMREEAPGDARLVAYIVATTDDRPPTTPSTSLRTGDHQQQTPFSILNSQFSIQELRDYLKTQLPDYMIPAAFVTLEALPLTPNGKLDRRALPAPGAPERGAAYVAPRTELERTIVGAWQAALRIERIGIDDSFFDLGGHSLLMIQVHSKLRELLKRDIAMLDLFAHPTVAALARHLSRPQDERSALQVAEERAEKLEDGKNRLKQRLKQRQQAEKDR
jgi:hypothetical protein